MAASIYTKTGDRGTTGLLSGERVEKDHPRVEAYGTLDELQCHLGLLRARCGDRGIAGMAREIQADLQVACSELASQGPPGLQKLARRLGEEDLRRLEGWIDELAGVFPLPDRFVLPGESDESALAHLARAVCRRGERRVAGLARRDGRLAGVLRYLNRLSDLLFTMAWALERQAEVRRLLAGPAGAGGEVPA